MSAGSVVELRRGFAPQLPGPDSYLETTKKSLPEFSSYMSSFEVQEKLKKEEVFEGVLRINPKNYEDAYISAPGGGTDIYIGGVHDRNAALHGDCVVVELLPPECWKVLYDRLDFFLERDETLKNAVYAEHDSFATMDQFVPPGTEGQKFSCSAAQNCPNSDIVAVNIPKAVINTSAAAVVQDVYEDQAKKKKKTRRNKKKLKNQNNEDFSGPPPRDSLVLLSSTVTTCKNPSKISLDQKKEKSQPIVVPPDMLSECSDVSDNESACSDTLDLDTAHEDRCFFNAQRAAAGSMQRDCSEKQSSGTTEACIENSDSGAGADKPVVEENNGLGTNSTLDAIMAVKEGVNRKVCSSTETSLQVESVLESVSKTKNEVKKEDALAVEQKSSGRITAAESLFGVKPKRRNKLKKKKENSLSTDSTEAQLSALSLLPTDNDSKMSNIQCVKTVPETIAQAPVIGLAATDRQRQLDSQSSEQFTYDADAPVVDYDPSIQFMVSPFNQQLNFAPSLARAHNNWLQHPLLNSFGNNISDKYGNLSVQPYSDGQQRLLNSRPQQEPKPMSWGQFMLREQSSQPLSLQQHWQQNEKHNNFIGKNKHLKRNHHMKQSNKNDRQQNRSHENELPRFMNAQESKVKSDQQQNLNQSREEENARTSPSVKQVMRLSNWERFVQKVGYVVHILERRNTRLGAGTLKPFQDMNSKFALFSPNDSRIPRMKIPMSQCPANFLSKKEEYAKRIYLARITTWTDSRFALGELVRDLGRYGDIKVEMEAYLLQTGIDYSDFPEDVLESLPNIPESGWTISPKALFGRRDLRDQCIFTIDPATARDLDDALSCEPLPHQRYRVGVHIADVSFFLHPGTALDDIAASRANSVYLVDQVIPMLPRVLCEQLCSLNPDEDRLTVSVIWELDRAGQVLSSWFGRTIVRSCVKLSYDHAQQIIDNPDQKCWEEAAFPKVSRFSIEHVCQTVLLLHSLAMQMQMRRYLNGALRLDQKKLTFSLDEITKMPNAVSCVEHMQSNFLVEEFMLLANISVAHKIIDAFPSNAVLRCHPAPQGGPLEDTVGMLRALNIDIDTSSAGAIYSSILRLVGNPDFTAAQLEVVVNMLSKPMQNALYFCSGSYLEDFSHYALNVPFYTHFTSPIRRYPDVMVHRLLLAAVDAGRSPLPAMDIDEIDRRLSVANEKKKSAKCASEYSAELYLAEFVRKVGEIRTTAIVLGVLNHALDLLLLDYCTIKRAYLEKLPLDALNFDSKSKNEPPAIHVVWSADHERKLPSIAQSFTYFTPVSVMLTPFTNDQLKFNVTVVRPES